MTLVKATPTFATMKHEFDRAFDRFFEPPLWPLPAPRAFDTMWEPTLDLAENAKEYVLRLEAPGMARDDFDVAMDGNLLTLAGKREFHRQEQGEEYLWQERQEGCFRRTLRLPGAVQEPKIEATYIDGVLAVKLPKVDPPNRTKVTIK